MQRELSDEYWEGKRLQEARESAMKNGIGLLDIAERLGILKGRYTNLEDFFEGYNGAVNQMVDMILKNINLKADFETAKTKTATEKPPGIDECCEECGNVFTPGEVRWQITHPTEPKFCYKCKKEKGLVK